ncbi:MAG: type I-A CRISPR-associated protein Cas4/Csa1 [Crenarchaeota archaeon]|nr:type I-A CRISPR-associated protein Cas4/Csa1 [Thermoproteota archaeon]
MVLPRRVWDYIRSLLTAGEAGAEVRGWRFELVSPRYRYRPAVSEIATYCPSRRDLYLKRVEGVPAQQVEAARRGVVLHEVFLEPLRLASRGDGVDLDSLAAARRRLYRRLGVRPSRLLDRVYTMGAALALQMIIDGDTPVAVEPAIPGAAVGLTDVVKPDLLVGFIPVEITTASPNSLYGRRKQLTVAGYALALEAWMGNPIDYGVIAYLRERDGVPWLDWRVVVLTDDLRRAFLRARDEAAMIVDTRVDPGAAGEGCPDWCPYRGICSGAGGGSI